MTDNNLNQVPESSQEEGWKKMQSQISDIKWEVAQNLGESKEWDVLVQKVTADLSEKFGSVFNVSAETLRRWDRKINITPNSLEKKWEAEITITVEPNSDIFIRINPYKHYQEYYYEQYKLSYEQFSKELENIEIYLNTGDIPEDTLLKKKELIQNAEDYM